MVRPKMKTPSPFTRLCCSNLSFLSGKETLVRMTASVTIHFQCMEKRCSDIERWPLFVSHILPNISFCGFTLKSKSMDRHYNEEKKNRERERTFIVRKTYSLNQGSAFERKKIILVLTRFSLTVGIIIRT